MLSIFKFDSEDHVFYTDDSNVIWVKASPVANKLGFKRPEVAVVNNVDPDLRAKISTGVGAASWFVTEPGFYQLTFASQHPNAKRFQRWVFEKVLPSIRRRGGYIQDTAKYVATASDAEISDIYATMGARKLTEAWALDCLEFDHDKETVVTNEEMKLSFKNWLRQHHRTLDDAQISKCSMYVKVHCEWRYKPPVSKDVKIKVDGKFVRGLPGVSFKF
jgi:prophage antirepressor-like protein